MTPQEKIAAQRRESLMPGGVPRYLRIYDNGGAEAGGSYDRYTAAFTGRYEKNRGAFLYVAFNGCPTHPMGFWQHGETIGNPVDYPRSAHLGRRIDFGTLPEECQKLLMKEYRELWNIQN